MCTQLQIEWDKIRKQAKEEEEKSGEHFKSGIRIESQHTVTSLYLEVILLRISNSNAVFFRPTCIFVPLVFIRTIFIVVACYCAHILESYQTNHLCTFTRTQSSFGDE